MASHQHLLHALQLEERAACSAEFGNSLHSSRSEIADLNVRIQKLRSQILSIKSHVSSGGPTRRGSSGNSNSHTLACPVHVRPDRVTWAGHLAPLGLSFLTCPPKIAEDHMSFVCESALYIGRDCGNIRQPHHHSHPEPMASRQLYREKGVET